jgi:hypothetical protein
MLTLAGASLVSSAFSRWRQIEATDPVNLIID